MLQKWKFIINNWINCYFDKTSQDECHVNIESLLTIISNLRDNLNLDESKSSVLEAHTVEEFILEKYPSFKFKNGTIKASNEEDLYFVASLLLYFVCVNSKDVDMKSAMCSKLSVNDQEIILKFSKTLMDCSSITCEDVQAAISEACGNEMATIDTGHVRVPVAETPPALRSLHSEVRRLHAALEAERFDRNFLQEELARTNMRVEKLLKDKEQYKLDIMNLKTKISLCCGENHDGRQAETTARESAKLARQLEDMEERLIRTQELLDEAVYERDGLKAKLEGLKQDRDKWLALSQQESARSVQLTEELETERRQVHSLKELITELRMHNRLNRLDSSLLECDDPDASIQSLGHNLSVCSEACANVIDVQLGEERAKNAQLRQQIETLQKENEQLHFAIEDDNSNHELILKEKDLIINNLEKQLKEQAALLESLRKEHETVTLSWEKHKLETRDIIQAKDEHIKKLNEQLVSLKQEFAELESVKDALTKNIDMLVKEYNEEKRNLFALLEEEKNKYDVILKEKDMLQNQLVEEKAAKDILETEKINLIANNNNLLTEKATIANELAEEKSLRQVLTEKKNELSAQKAATEKKFSKQVKQVEKKLTKEVAKVAVILQEKEQIVQQLKEEKSLREAVEKEMADLVIEKTHLDHKVRDLKSLKEELTKEVDQLVAKKDTLEQECLKQKEINKELTEELEKEKLEKNDLSQEKEVLKRDLVDHKAILEVLNKDKNLLIEEKNGLVKSLELEKSAHDELENEKSGLCLKLKEVNEHFIAELNNKEDELQKASEDMKQLAVKLKGETELTQQISTTIDVAVDKLIQDLDKKEFASTTLQNVIKIENGNMSPVEKCEQLIYIANALYSEAVIKIDLEKDLEYQKAALEEVREVLNQKEIQIFDLQAESTKLQQIATEANSELIKQNENFTSALENKQAEIKLLQHENQNLKNDLNTTRIHLDLKVNSLKEILVNNETASDQMKEQYECQINNLNAMVSTLTNYLKDKTAELECAVNERDWLQQVIEDNHKEEVDIDKVIENINITGIQSLQNEMAATRENLEKIISDCESEKLALKNMLTDTQSAMDNQKISLNNTISELTNANIILQEEIKTIKNIIEKKTEVFEQQMKEKETALTSAEKELAELKVANEDLEQKLISQKEVSDKEIGSLRAENQNRYDENRKLREKMKALKTQKKGLNQEINELKAALQDKEDEVKMMVTEKHEYETIIRNYEENELMLKNQITQLQNKIDENEAEFNSKINKITESYQMEVEDKKQLINKLNKEVNTVLDMKKELGQLEEKIKILTQEKDSLIADKDDYVNKFNEMQTVFESNSSKVSEEIHNLKKYTAELEKDIEVLKKAKTELEENIRNLNKDNSEFVQNITKLSENKIKLKQNIAKINEENAKLHADNINLIEKVDKLYEDNLKLEQNIDKLNEDNTKLEINIAKLSENKMELETNIAKLNEDNVKLEHNIVKLHEDNLKLEQNVTELTGGNTKLEQNNAELSEYNTKLEQNIAKLNEENNKLELNIAKLNEDNANLEQNIEVLNEDNIKLEQNIAKLSEDNANLEQNIAKLNQGSITLEQNIAKLGADNAQLQQNIAQLNAGNTKLEQNIAKLSEDNVNLEQNIAKLNEDNAILEQNIAKLSEDNAKLEKYIAKLNEDNAKLEENIAKLSRDNIVLKQNIAKLNEDNAKLEENIVKINEDKMKLTENTTNLNEEIANLRNINEKVNENNVKLEQIIAKLKEDNTKLQRNIVILNENNAKLVENIAKLNEDNTKLDQNIIKLNEENCKLKDEITGIVKNATSEKAAHEEYNKQLSTTLSAGLNKLIQDLKKEDVSHEIIKLTDIDNDSISVVDKCDMLINITNMLTTEVVVRKNLEKSLKHENAALVELGEVLKQKDMQNFELQSEVKRLQQVVNETKIELSKQNETYTTTNNKNLREIQSLQSENQSLTNDLNDVKVQLEVKVHSLKEKLIDNENLTDKLKKTYECQIENLNIMITKLTNYLKDKTAELDTLRKEKDRLQQVIDENNKAIKSLEDEVKNEKQSQEKLMEDFESERQIIKNMVAVTESVMEDQKTAFNNTIAEQAKTIEMVKEENRTIIEENEIKRKDYEIKLQEKQSVLEMLLKELAEVKQEKESEKKENELQKEVFEKEINDLKSDIQKKEDEIKRLNGEMNLLIATNQSYKENADSLANENNELKIKYDEIEVEFRNNVERLTASLQEEIDTKKELNIELDKMTNNIASMENQIKELKEKINTLENIKTELISEKDDYLVKANGIQSSLETNLTKASEDIAKSKKYVDDLVKENEKLKLDSKAFEQEIDKLKTDNSELSNEIDKLKISNTDLSKEIDKLKISNTELSEAIDKLKTENSELLEEVTKSKSNNMELVNTIEEKITAITKLEQAIKQEQEQHKKLQEDIANEKVNLVNKCDILENYHNKAEKELEERQKEIVSLQKEVQSLQAKVEYSVTESAAKDGLISKMSKEKDAIISDLNKNLLEEKVLREKYQKEFEEKIATISELKKNLNEMNNERKALSILKKENEELIKAVGQRETFAVRSHENTASRKYSGQVAEKELRDIHHQVDNTSDITHSSIESLKTITDLEKIIHDKNRTITTLQSDVTYLKTLMAESENKLLDVAKELEVSKENCHQLSTQLKKIVHQKNEEIAEYKRQVSKMSVTENRATQIIKVSAKYQAIILKRIAEIKSNTVLKELTNFGNTNTNTDSELRRSLNAGSITMEDLENFLETTERHLKKCSEKQLALQKEKDRLTEVNRIHESEIINLKKFLTELSVSFQTFSSVKDLYAQKLSRVISVQRTVRREILSLDGHVTDTCMLKLERGYAAVMQDLAECSMNLERWVERCIGRTISSEKIKQAFMSDNERSSLAPSSVQNAGLEVQLDELEKSFQKLLEEVSRAQKGEGAKDAQAVTLMEVRAEYEDKLNRMKAKMKQLYTEQIAVFKEKQKEEIAMLERELARARDTLSQSSRAYEEHIRSLTTELWSVGEKFLMQKDEANYLRRKQRSGSLMSLQHVHSSGFVSHQEDPGRPSDTQSLRSLPVNNNTNNNGAKREGRGLHMSDEEGEVFDNRYLRELSTPQRTRDPARLSELRWRNSLCPPHLKSSYPAETQFAPVADEDEIKATCGAGAAARPQRKEVGITAYKKPGPPTPSKQAGRLSATDSELRESLRVEAEPHASRKTSTPSRIRSLFRSTKTEATEGTPRSRRLSNIFRKK